MKPYPSYKDSGIEWIGKIPKEWQIKKLKYLDQVIMGQSPESEVCNKNGIGLPFLQGNADFSSRNPEPSVWCEQPNKVAQKHDILLSVRAPVGAVNIADQTYGIGRGLCAIRTLHSQNSYLYFRTLCLEVELKRIATGSTYDAVSAEQVKNTFVPDPGNDEQKAIAIYLDRKTAQIDDLIAKKERMIELLKENRTAIINEAVTKGIDSNVEMKDTGIEWLGKIPKHWQIKKLKYISLVNNMTLSEATDENYEFNYIDISNVNLEEGFTLEEKINFVNAPSRARRIVRKGDTIISTVRTYLKALTYFEDDVHDMIVSTGFAVISPSKYFIPKFLYYILRSEKFIDRVCALSVGVSYPAINSMDLSDIFIWFPDNKNEQDNIVKYLDKIVTKSNDAIQRLQREISYLQDYRTALISEVVTGKLDIRSGDNA